MARDLKKESVWRKKKYERIVADLDQSIGIELKEHLQASGKTITDWVLECANRELGKE